ncbi:MAG: transcriptional regulator [Acidimicrobiia bacterium]|nr:transcriptional regulator [Acidimicrobiia bacterium]
MAKPEQQATVTTTVDRLIHEPARLAIMTNLFVVESANATYLLQQTGLTWGNLGSHLIKLEEAGYVDVVKGYNGRKPETTVSLTDKGRDALLGYRGQLLEALAPLAGD